MFIFRFTINVILKIPKCSKYKLQLLNDFSYKLKIQCHRVLKAASSYKTTRPSDFNDKINFLSSHRFVVRIHSVLSKIYYMSDIQHILTKYVINVFIWIESNIIIVYNIHVYKRIRNKFEQLTSSLNNHIQYIHVYLRNEFDLNFLKKEIVSFLFWNNKGIMEVLTLHSFCIFV